jgi:3-carboxy-cis,cis-muconate cycloisomerase
LIDQHAGRPGDGDGQARTHGQHAVPITFDFKVAVWIDEITRHVTRLRRAEDHAFVAMTGGAAGTFASLGSHGPTVQAEVAHRLGLRPMSVPAHSIADPFAEYVCARDAALTSGKIVHEAALLMKTEVGEVREPKPPATVGSSTMPHKRNPQRSKDVLTISAQIRARQPRGHRRTDWLGGSDADVGRRDRAAACA